MKIKQSNGNGKRSNVIVIEDNDDLREAITSVISARGYCVEAVDSVEALTETQLKAQIYVVDLNLPGRDGLDLVKHLRRVSPRSRVIIVSARERASDLEAGYASGADVYLTKPVAPQILLAALSSVAGRLEDMPDKTDRCLYLNALCCRLEGSGGQVSVSPREVAFLRQMVIAPGGRLETWQIAELFGMNLDHNIKKALEVRLVRLRKKISTAVGYKGPTILSIRNYGYELAVEIKIRG